jgi:ribosomal protein S18 acetylase RimI-like enzyme
MIMIYETFNPERHDLMKVANLVYDVDYRTFDMLFRDEASAVRTIAKDLPKRGLGDYFKVMLDDDGEIIGMLMVYNARVSHKIYLKSLRLLIVDILDHFALADIEDDDLYLAEIAIDSSQRGQGLGRKVVCDVIDYAKSKGYRRVTIDADFRNEGARRLYENIGFKEFNKKSVKFLSFERGMHNMEYVLND